MGTWASLTPYFLSHISYGIYAMSFAPVGAVLSRSRMTLTLDIQTAFSIGSYSCWWDVVTLGAAVCELSHSCSLSVTPKTMRNSCALEEFAALIPM